MYFKQKIVKDKIGHNIKLRSTDISDATTIIEYLKITADETPYLLNESEEISFTKEQEIEFIQNKINSKKELLLLAFVEDNLIGSCSLTSIGNSTRFAHRCSVSIAIKQNYCNMGIGKLMMETILNIAKQVGYEQVELEVMSKNKNAIVFYKKLGFRKYGTLPNNIKYKDDSYDDTYWMMKTL